MNNYLIGHSYKSSEHFRIKEVSKIKNTYFTVGQLALDRDSPYFPTRSDEKIMREDIKAAVVSLGTLIENSDCSKEDLTSIPLFVANGAFVDNPEKHLNRISGIFKNFTPETTDAEKKRKIYFATPPLLALETLTNSTMSFIAQYHGLKGHNYTYGNTSIGSFFAISDALAILKNTKNKKVIVSAANSGGVYSFLTNSTVTGYAEKWKESAAVGNLLMCRSENLPENVSCKITFLNSSKNVPNMEVIENNRNWKTLVPTINADLIIFSGAFTEEDYKKDESYCKDLNSNVFSLYEDFGNMGPSNLILGIIKGVDFLKNGICIVDIVDRDIYGRESLVRIEKC